MKKCNAAPYEGSQPYIYVDYTQRDRQYVYPVVERLAQLGYRVYHDDGTGYPEVVAEKILSCGVFLAFITENAVVDKPFRNELLFANQKKKDIIAVILEDVDLSLGMQLTLSVIPMVYKYALEDGDFYQRLAAFEAMKGCLGQPNPDVRVSEPSEYALNMAELYGIDDRRKPPLGEELFCSRDSFRDGAFTAEAVLIRLSNQEQIPVTVPKMIIGRVASPTEQPVVDYALQSNSMISRIHAVIRFRDDQFYLVDCGAENKTFLGGKPLEANVEYLLRDGDSLRFANEKFLFRRIEG